MSFHSFFSNSNLPHQRDASRYIAERLLERTSVLAGVGGWQVDVRNKKCVWSQVTKAIHEVEPDYEPDLESAIHFYKEGASRERIKAAVEKGMKDGTGWCLELDLITAKGREIQVHAIGEVVFENGNPAYIFGTFQDITERKKSEKLLNDAKEAAEKTIVLRSRFLDTAAHELRTPIAAISLLIELAQRESGAGKVLGASLLGRLQLQANRLSRLVVELLDVSRLERGFVTLSLSLTDLSDLLEETVDIFRAQYPHREILLFGTDEKVEICIDPLRISQVVSNLIDNAAKYTSPELPIEVSLVSRGQRVEVAVTDRGKGLSGKEQEGLFLPFVRGVEEDESQRGGLGLGLFISQEILKMHGSCLKLFSELGQGSRFFFELEKNGVRDAGTK